jgi:hypothetical protein
LSCSAKPDAYPAFRAESSARFRVALHAVDAERREGFAAMVMCRANGPRAGAPFEVGIQTKEPQYGHVDALFG